ncbi:hypothetical protein MAR_026524, partial [Mya arenaria]
MFFFHIPVHKDHQHYLAFSFQCMFYRWNVLPFGHSCSPYFFNKVLRPVIAFLRSKGLRIVVLISLRKHWNEVLTIDKYSINDLQWWFDSVLHWNTHVVVDRNIEAQLVTDASKTGWGAWIQDLQAQGFWNGRVSQSSSNFRELFAVLMTILSFKKKIHGKHIQVLSDNITTVAFLNGMGGSVTSLDKIVRTIHLEAIECNIHLSARYISGRKNWKADYLSRIKSTYEWKLHPALFR